MREVCEGLTKKSCVFGLVRVGACVKFGSGKWKKSSLLAFPGSKTARGGVAGKLGLSGVQVV